MTAAGWVGIALLAAGVVAIVVEAALAGIWARRVSQRARELSLRAESGRALIAADVERLQQALAETAVLWRPYQRALRWLRHPLAVALLRSYSQRRAASR